MWAMPLDQTADKNQAQLHEFNKLYGLPDFVKQAATDDVFNPGADLRLYADRVHKRFPVHTKAATYVSWMYFLNGRDQIAAAGQRHIEERLQKAANYWQLTQAVAALTEKVKEAQAEEHIPDHDFALVIATAGAEKDRRYPLRDAGETKTAASWFAQYEPQIRQEFPAADRRQIAARILQKAANYGAGLSAAETELLERHAGQGLGSPSEIASMLRNRIKAASRVEATVREHMEKLASSVESQPNAYLHPSSLQDLVAVVDTFDRTHGLLNKYSAGVEAPEQVVFSQTTTKLAALRENLCQLPSGTLYDARDFTKISAEALAELLGTDLVREVTTGLQLDPIKMATVIATLPRDDARTFDALAADYGVRPLAKEAAAQLGFSFSDWQTLV